MRYFFSKGFSLIELMVVVAIVGVLAGLALPSYQNYTKRAMVSEGLIMLASAKQNVADIFSMGMTFANAEGYGIGYQPPTQSENVNGLAAAAPAGYLNSITAVNSAIKIEPVTGQITIPFSTRVEAAGSNVLVFVPYFGPAGAEVVLPDATNLFTPPKDSIKWKCRANGATSPFSLTLVNAATLPMRYAPAECR